MDAKYLKITIHDNDFTSYIGYLAEAIMNMFKWNGWKPKSDKDLENLKPAIAHIWYGLDMICHAAGTRPGNVNIYNYIMDNLELSIEEFEYIPESMDKCEDLYIPLSKSDDFLFV